MRRVAATERTYRESRTREDGTGHPAADAIRATRYRYQVAEWGDCIVAESWLAASSAEEILAERRAANRAFWSDLLEIGVEERSKQELDAAWLCLSQDDADRLITDVATLVKPGSLRKKQLPAEAAHLGTQVSGRIEVSCITLPEIDSLTDQLTDLGLQHNSNFVGLGLYIPRES